MARERRHALIAQFLADGTPATQEDIAAFLADSGEPVTQATVSRDLASIGAVRAAGGYRLQTNSVAAPTENGEQLASVVRQHVLSIHPAATLIVMRTAPGHANVVAAVLDRKTPKGMVGCIAGDDTIMIATPSRNAATTLMNHLQSFLEAA